MTNTNVMHSCHSQNVFENKTSNTHSCSCSHANVYVYIYTAWCSQKQTLCKTNKSVILDGWKSHKIETLFKLRTTVHLFKWCGKQCHSPKKLEHPILLLFMLFTLAGNSKSKTDSANPDWKPWKHCICLEQQACMMNANVMQSCHSQNVFENQTSNTQSCSCSHANVYFHIYTAWCSQKQTLYKTNKSVIMYCWKSLKIETLFKLRTMIHLFTMSLPTHLFQKQ